MKKILYPLLALVALLVVSCSNEEIEITTVAPIHNLNINISTQGMYDTFGLTEKVRQNYLRDKKYAIGVTTFLFDSNGNLVESLFSSAYTFGQINHSFDKVVEGNYTIISVEMLVNPNNDLSSDCWKFEDTDKLSTLQVGQKTHLVSDINALGVTSQNVVVSGDASINLSPSAIGSLVHAHYYNFKNSTNVEVAFATGNVIDAYKLDPSLSSNDKYYYKNYTESGFTNIRGSLTAEESESSYLTLYLLEPNIDWKFNFKKQDDLETNKWTYYEQNTGKSVLQDGVVYYGGFYYLGDEYYPLSYFGDKNGFDTWLEQTQSIYDNIVRFVTPYQSWKSSVNAVQSYMNQYTMTIGSSGKAILQNDGSYMLSYNGKNSESEILYYFTAETTGLFEADVLFDKGKVKKDALLDCLNDNYSFLVESEGLYMYCTSDGLTYVVLSETEDSWVIGYVDVSYVNPTNANNIAVTNYRDFLKMRIQ